MDLIPVMYELSSRMSNKTIEFFSCTSLWPSIAASAQDPRWWRQRCETLLERRLVREEGMHWADVYRSLLLVKDKPRFDKTLCYSELLIDVLLEIGADPVERTRIEPRGMLVTVGYGPKIMSNVYRPLRFVVQGGDIAAVTRMLSDPRIGADDLNMGAGAAIESGKDCALDVLLADLRMTQQMRFGFDEERCRRRPTATL